MKSCAIVQSNYLPWKGYFDLINTVDEFVIFDCVQYTRRDWRNRNKIKTASGPKWLTVPVKAKGNYEAEIDTILVDDPKFAEHHWHSLEQNYSKSPFYHDFSDGLKKCFEGLEKLEYLSEVNRSLLEHMCSCLGIKTRISNCRSFEIVDGKSERLLSLCKQIGADIYYSGPAAQDYLDESLFEASSVKVKWMSYAGYPEYPQLFPPFEHSVSAIDLLFNVGPDARKFMLT